ncbi:MAG: hypothetical protein E7447_04550 [Ruminococcaceae bacterium]|nr:hypothetical protein [Oscillospiraceae bacterium]
MNNTTCKTCGHFRQHYILSEGKFLRIFCGHCTFSGSKTRKPFAKACEHYEFAPADVDAFATKEYLTKELLQYVLHLELLPEIDDAP